MDRPPRSHPGGQPITAAEAKQSSQDHLEQDTQRWREIRPLTSFLRRSRIDNHLSQRMEIGWKEFR